MIVVGHRIDALTLAYRVRLEQGLLDYLEARAVVAREHGRAACSFESLIGELRYSRTPRVYNVTGPLLRCRIDQRAAGQVELEGADKEPGWTLEIIWAAQALADMGLAAALDASHRLADELGAVFEKRVRRIDVCADVAGRPLSEADRLRLVRRSRARLTEHAAHEPPERLDELPCANCHRARRACACGPALHETRAITGLTVCPGGALMARLYNKRAELDLQPQDKRETEEGRWLRAGWDGVEPVTRVEFQLRGPAIREFGVRDPEQAVEPHTGLPLLTREESGAPPRPLTLRDRVDAIWQRCLDWLRLVKDDASRLARCSDDDVWTLLRKVVFFAQEARPAPRARIRGPATCDQVLGCALAILGRAGELTEVPEGFESLGNAEAEAHVRAGVRRIFDRVTLHVLERLLSRWPTAQKALEHVSVVSNAVRLRFWEERDPWDDVGIDPRNYST